MKIHCPTCGEQVDSNDQACSYCGEAGAELQEVRARLKPSGDGGEKSRTLARLTVLVATTLAVITAASAIHRRDRARSAPAGPATVTSGDKVPSAERAVGFIQDAIARGAMRLDYEKRQVWIDSAMWRTSDNQRKRLARAMAAYFDSLKRAEHQQVDFVDKQSGKKLASYSDAAGLEVY